MTRNLAPIVLFVYNRLSHVEHTLTALQKNFLAKESELIIFSDGPKDEITAKDVEKVRKYLKSIRGFKKVKVVEREENLGLSQSIIQGVTEIVNQYGKVIVLEDDIITSPYFLQFMNKSLEMYKDVEKVASVNSYMYPIGERLPETFFLRMSDCWGWGTWKRAWDLFEPDGRKLLKEIESRNLGAIFNFEHNNYAQMLEDQVNGKNDSWAIRWYASTFLKGKFGYYPRKSLITNIGLDGTGVHCGIGGGWNSELVQVPISVERVPVIESKMARSAMERCFASLKPSPLENIARNSLARLFPKLKRQLKILLQKNKCGFEGNYSSWQDALSKSEGYDSQVILEKVKDALLKVKEGKAAYERDSVLFDKVQYSQPLLNQLLRIAKSKKRLHVLDFGGSLGSTYYQNQAYLSDIKDLRWCIVEQKNFVDCGKTCFEDDRLCFYHDLEECLKKENIDVIILSSVLPYLENPYELIAKIMSYKIDNVIIDRTPVLDEVDEDRLTIQKVDPAIYSASYPAWFLNRNRLVECFLSEYSKEEEFDALTGEMVIRKPKAKARDKGFIFTLKE